MEKNKLYSINKEKKKAPIHTQPLKNLIKLIKILKKTT